MRGRDVREDKRNATVAIARRNSNERKGMNVRMTSCRMWISEELRAVNEVSGEWSQISAGDEKLRCRELYLEIVKDRKQVTVVAWR